MSLNVLLMHKDANKLTLNKDCVLKCHILILNQRSVCTVCVSRVRTLRIRGIAMSPLVLVALYNNRHWQSGKLPHIQVDSDIMGGKGKTSQGNSMMPALLIHQEGIIQFKNSQNFTCVCGVGYFIPSSLPAVMY